MLYRHLAIADKTNLHRMLQLLANKKPAQLYRLLNKIYLFFKIISLPDSPTVAIPPFGNFG